MMAVFMLYRSGRMFTRDATDQAMANAGRVIDFERALGIFNERAVQGWALSSDAVVDFLNRYYVAVHFPLTIAFLVWAYIRHQNAYRFIRTWFVAVTLAALVIHVGFPLAPPRMTTGFVDTLHEFGPRIYSKDPRRSVTNQFAAMPSLHFGWAFMMAIGFVAIKRSRNSVLMMLHPAITLLAIVATGNHYWLDAIVAGLLAAIVAVTLGAWRLHRTGRLDGQRLAEPQGDSWGGASGDTLVPAFAGAGDEHGCPLATHSRDRCRQHAHERHERIELETAGSPGAHVATGSSRADHPPDER